MFKNKSMKYSCCVSVFILLGLMIFLSGCTDVKSLQEEYGLDLNEKTVTIPGLEEEYTILFLSDTHCSVPSDKMIEAWQISSSDRANSFSNDLGLTSGQQFEGWIKIANEINPDLMILGGDVIDYLSEDNAALIKTDLDKLNVPYLYVIGNHDSYDVMKEYGGGFHDDSPLLDPFWQGQSSECQVVDCGEFLIVGINNYGPKAKALVSSQALSGFKEAYTKGKPIVLVCHVPFTTQETQILSSETYRLRGDHRLLGENCGYDLDENTKEFMEMVLDDDSPVKLVLSGHVHFPNDAWLNSRTFQIVSDTSSNGSGILLKIKGE